MIGFVLIDFSICHLFQNRISFAGAKCFSECFFESE